MGCAASTVTDNVSKHRPQKVVVRDLAGGVEVEVNFLERTRSFDSMREASCPSESKHSFAPIKATHDAYVRRFDKLMNEIQSQPTALLREVSMRRKTKNDINIAF